ncbi:MAG TPA: CoA transferase [Stellaceae bacterium]|nr:CoA transferase [Stellaceae bacterium]
MPDQAQPLSSLTVVDLGTGMAPAVAVRILADAGARVIRVEPAAGDPFYDVYPAYRVWHRGKEIERLVSLSDPRLAALLGSADVAILGGEDFPGHSWRADAAAIAAAHPRLVVLDITGYPPGLDAEGRPAAELLVEARSGITFEQYSDRPMAWNFRAAQCGAALQGVVAVLAALCARERTGSGQLATTSLWEGAVMWCLPHWYAIERPSGSVNFVMPKDPHALIFRCADGKYVHFVLGSFGSKGRLYRILGIDDPSVHPDDPGMPSPAKGNKNFFGDIDLLTEYVARIPSDTLLAALWEAGVAGDRVLPPGGCWDDPQVQHNGIVKTLADGTRTIGLPFSLTGAGETPPPVPLPPGEGERNGPISPPPPAGGGWGEGATPSDNRDPSKNTSLRAVAHEGDGVLSGITVLDFGPFVAGPYTSIALVDLGAEVIKVEPLTGDPNRAVFRSFASVNRGKRSIAVELKTPEGAEIVRLLTERANVVINNFRPGVSERLGLDPASLHRRKPDLVVLETTGYGSTGPSGQRAGYDMIFQAFCGFEDLGASGGRAPLWNRSAMVDYAGGIAGSIALLIALWQRGRTGAGASAATNLLNAGLTLLPELIRRPDGAFTGVDRLNPEHTGTHPANACYRTADGWIALVLPTDAMAATALEELGLSAKVAPSRAAWDAADAEVIASAIAARSSRDLLDAFERRGVWAEPCLEKGESHLVDPALAARGTLFAWESRKLGTVTQLGRLFQLAGSKSAARPIVPEIGEDTRDVLAELGYAAAEIDDLVARKIVRECVK